MFLIADHFYTQREAARRLSVNRHTIRNWVLAGKLPAQKAGAVVFIEKSVVEDLRRKRKKARERVLAGEGAA